MSLPDLNPVGYVIDNRMQKGHKGWDVRALQRALQERGYALSKYGADGDFGDETKTAVANYQRDRGLYVDGWAGSSTQKQLCLELIAPVELDFQLPTGLARGQVGAESSFFVGNNSEKHPDDEYFDIGVVQLNSKFHSYEEGFDPGLSIRYYGEHTKDYYKKYKAIGKITNPRRLWELAAGAWNAPAWTDRLANGQSLTQTQSDHIEDYINRVTVFLAIL